MSIQTTCNFATMTMMRHYWHVASDGRVHVQNVVGPYLGQHHVHGKKAFAEWRKSVVAENLIHLKDGMACKCGLKAGEVREGKQ